MNSNILKKTVVVILPLLLAINVTFASPGTSVPGYQGDSLRLVDIVAEVIENHPTIKEVNEAIDAADARIGLARTGYNPEMDASVNYSNMGPVIKLTIPSMGTFQLFPENNYSAAINYRQTIYDFGRTKQNIAVETESKAVTEQMLEQAKQKLALATINNFFTLAFLQSAIKIKEQQLVSLGEHLKHIETKLATGSATEYQVLSTKVKISAVNSQKFDLEAALKYQQAILNSLLGLPDDNLPVVSNDFRVEVPVVSKDSLISFAFHNRNEMLLNEMKSSVAGLKYDLLKAMNRPVVSFMATGGAKNGYVPELNRIRPNYVVGVGVRIPIYDGSRTKYNLLQAQSSINALGYEKETSRRVISSEVREAEAYMNAANEKISQFRLQLDQAMEAFSLARVSFESGTITNLDLLDSNNAVSESRLMLMKAIIDYTASVYRLKAAIGEKVY